jgi:hypothetical protein
LTARADVSRATTQPSAQDKPLALFERFIGTWLGEAKWANGEPMRTRIVYEYGVGERVIEVHSFVIDPAGDAKHVYDTFAYLHPRDGQIRFVSISNAGGVYDGTVSGTRDQIIWEWSAYLGDRTAQYKQTLRMLNDDAYQWTVWQKAGEEWQQIIDAEIKREPNVPKSANAK